MVEREWPIAQLPIGSVCTTAVADIDGANIDKPLQASRRRALGKSPTLPNPMQAKSSLAITWSSAATSSGFQVLVNCSLVMSCAGCHPGLVCEGLLVGVSDTDTTQCRNVHFMF
jgi:hypothetical protein